MIDAIVPAVDVLMQEAENSKSLSTALKHAAEAAEQGAQSTIGLQARFGKGTNAGRQNRAASVQDPGATSVFLFLAGLAKHLQEV